MSQVKLTGAQSAYLDLVRGGAALAVLFGHAAGLFLNGTWLQKANIQAFGVLVFFLLSGFLISYSVFQKHKELGYGFRDYFIDRFARIYCAFLPALLFVALVDSQTMAIYGPIAHVTERMSDLTWLDNFQMRMTLPNWIANVFMLQDYPLFQVLRRAGVPDGWFFRPYGTDLPLWTIPVEWWIYMVFGLIAIVRVKQRKGFRLWQWALFGFAAIPVLYYLFGGYDNCLTLMWITGMAASLLFLGLPGWVAARGIEPNGKSWLRGGLSLSAFGFVCLLGRMVALKINTGEVKFLEFHFGLFLAVALFGMLFAMGAFRAVPALLARGAKFLADYSFSLYLTHAPLLCFLYVRFPEHDHSYAFFFGSIAVANVFAIAFWWLFERHYRSVARWLKARTAPAALVTPAGETAAS